MKIVSFSLVVPYRGIPHAGGEFYLRYVEALVALGHEVVIVARRNAENEHALTQDRPPAEVVLVRAARDRRLDGARDRVAAVLRPHAVPPSARRAMTTDATVAARLADADLVEAQWEEMAYALKAAADHPTLLVAHDVPSQREWRWFRYALSTRRPAKALWRLWRWMTVRAQEPWTLRCGRTVLTLSRKDAELVRRRVGARTRVEWIDPPLWDEPGTPGADQPDADPPTVDVDALFVASFARRENVEAACWLLDEIWPRVVARRPAVRLALVGSGPPPALLERAAALPGVTVTGYVDRVAPWYQRSRVALVPLLSGAGVKFKTIDALVNGVPVVATSIGAEGIDAPRGDDFRVVDGASAFAEAVLGALDDAPPPRDPAGAAAAWARETYGRARFLVRLREIITATAGAQDGRAGG